MGSVTVNVDVGVDLAVVVNGNANGNDIANINTDPDTKTKPNANVDVDVIAVVNGNVSGVAVEDFFSVLLCLFFCPTFSVSFSSSKFMCNGWCSKLVASIFY